MVYLLHGPCVAVYSPVMLVRLHQQLTDPLHGERGAGKERERVHYSTQHLDRQGETAHSLDYRDILMEEKYTICAQLGIYMHMYNYVIM